MNTLTKNRIIEKGDEFRHKDGRWMPVPDKNVGLQIMFSEYKEVRRPSETPPKDFPAPVLAEPTGVERKTGGEVREGTSGDGKPQPDFRGGETPSEDPPFSETANAVNYLPTVVSRKAHLVHDPALDAMETEQAEILHAAKTIAVIPPPEIDYSDPLSAYPIWIGRNGTFKATGLNVSLTGAGDIVQLRPIGKRGLAKNALIEIPVADIHKLITRLKHLNYMQL
jgi:hypothetical protein